MNERARELYWEEWRNVELKRVSLCLARSGRPDEWGNTYSLENFDKQSGTDNVGGSYWYQRIVQYSMYSKEPIPNAAITANRNGKLSQNYGYDGYDPSVPKWENWEDAVADESTF